MGYRCNEGGKDNMYGLPSLAVASVPMQQWQMTYPPEKALQAGTMFAELDLPFEGGGCR